jgi:hypothetical protein
MNNNNIIQKSNKFGGPSWTSSHVYGDCSINYARGLYYVNIPKCASTWVKEYLALLGTTELDIWVGANFTQDDLNESTSLIFLRDPLKRFISHCPINPEIIKISNNKWAIEYVMNQFDELLLDEHMSRQTSFCQGIDLTKAVFFYCDDTLSVNFSHYLKSHSFPEITAPKMSNVGTSDQTTLLAKQSWKSILDRPECMKVFKQVYQNDYDLIEKAQFYRI